jgi:phosphatidylglycerol:prolipoprotein diacylglycerol transferase
MTHVFDPLRNSISIASIEIYFYSLLILTGVLIALYLGLKEGKKLGIKSDDILDGIIIILPLAILGARLYYVIFEWDRYRGNLASIFAFREGGLAIHGAFIVAVVAAYIYTRIKKIDIFRALDLIAPGFLVAQALGRWGNFFNQEAHGFVIGNVTNGAPNLSLDGQRAFLEETLRLPNFITNNMYLNGPSGLNYYHPTFLYESLWNLTGFAIMLILRRTKFLKSGDLIGFYLIWYSIGRFFIEGMRTDSLYVGNTGLRAAQIISILMVLLGAVFFVLNRTVFNRPNYHEVLEENQ